MKHDQHFICQFCAKAFATPWHLRRHQGEGLSQPGCVVMKDKNIRNIKYNPEFYCDYCAKSLITRERLKNHLCPKNLMTL